MAPSCVAIGQLASQYSFECAVCMCGVFSDFVSRLPWLARLSAISLPIIPACARTLCMWMEYGVQ